MSIFVILQLNELQWNNSREKSKPQQKLLALKKKCRYFRICCRWLISISEIEIWNTFTFSFLVLYRCGCCARVVSNAFQLFLCFPYFRMIFYSTPNTKKIYTCKWAVTRFSVSTEFFRLFCIYASTANTHSHTNLLLLVFFNLIFRSRRRRLLLLFVLFYFHLVGQINRIRAYKINAEIPKFIF